MNYSMASFWCHSLDLIVSGAVCRQVARASGTIQACFRMQPGFRAWMNIILLVTPQWINSQPKSLHLKLRSQPYVGYQ
jgi:hypothetical protein